jgi:hypothetical protein
MVWREQKDHFPDCYVCLTKLDGYNSKAKHAIVYPNIPSALRPLEHDDSLPIPKPPQQLTLPHKNQSASLQKSSCSNVDPDFLVLTVPHLISQSEFNDLVRNINLSKIPEEHLASNL